MNMKYLRICTINIIVPEISEFSRKQHSISVSNVSMGLSSSVLWLRPPADFPSQKMDLDLGGKLGKSTTIIMV